MTDRDALDRLVELQSLSSAAFATVIDEEIGREILDILRAIATSTKDDEAGKLHAMVLAFLLASRAP